MSNKAKPRAGVDDPVLGRRGLLGGTALAFAVAPTAEAGVQAPAERTAGEVCLAVQEIGSRAAFYCGMEDSFNDRYSGARFRDETIPKLKEFFGVDSSGKIIRDNVTWGSYQQVIADYDGWASKDPNPSDDTKKLSAEMFFTWEDFKDEARVGLSRRQLKLTNAQKADRRYWSNPRAPSFVQPSSLVAHLDEAVRAALCDTPDGTPIAIRVAKQGGAFRHHHVDVSWTLDRSGVPEKLNITMYCPGGGWQAYARWPRKDPDPLKSFKSPTQLVATLTVPTDPDPKGKDPIVFAFIGMETMAGKNSPGLIIQPVLQWHDNCWRMRNWVVSSAYDEDSGLEMPKPTDAQPTPLPGKALRLFDAASAPLSPGAKVMLRITSTGTKPNVRYESAFKLAGKPWQSLSHVPDKPMAYAIVAIEAYKADDPAMFPTPVLFEDIELQVGKQVEKNKWRATGPRRRRYQVERDAPAWSWIRFVKK